MNKTDEIMLLTAAWERGNAGASIPDYYLSNIPYIRAYEAGAASGASDIHHKSKAQRDKCKQRREEAQLQAGKVALRSGGGY